MGQEWFFIDSASGTPALLFKPILFKKNSKTAENGHFGQILGAFCSCGECGLPSNEPVLMPSLKKVVWVTIPLHITTYLYVTTYEGCH